MKAEQIYWQRQLNEQILAPSWWENTLKRMLEVQEKYYQFKLVILIHTTSIWGGKTWKISRKGQRNNRFTKNCDWTSSIIGYSKPKQRNVLWNPSVFFSHVLNTQFSAALIQNRIWMRLEKPEFPFLISFHNPDESKPKTHQDMKTVFSNGSVYSSFSKSENFNLATFIFRLKFRKILRSLKI